MEINPAASQRYGLGAVWILGGNDMNKSNMRFIQGVACAAAFIAREQDRPTMAADMLREFGYSYQDLVAAGTDSYDLDPLRKEMLR